MYDGILKECIRVANKSSYKLKVGAVVFKGKRILSFGCNDIRSSSIHNKYKEYHNSLHAEQAAVMNLDWNTLKGCSILVIRITPLGKLANSKPCPMCAKLLKHIGIKHIYYSTSKGEIKND